MKEITIRQAVKEDCPRMMELIHELAEYEKAPNEVTVSPEHFTESGFGRIRSGGPGWPKCMKTGKPLVIGLHYGIFVTAPGKGKDYTWKISSSLKPGGEKA